MNAAARGLLATALAAANIYLVWRVLQCPTPARVVATILGTVLAVCLAWIDRLPDHEDLAVEPQLPFETGTLLHTPDGTLLVLLDEPLRPGGEVTGDRLRGESS